MTKVARQHAARDYIYSLLTASSLTCKPRFISARCTRCDLAPIESCCGAVADPVNRSPFGRRARSLVDGGFVSKMMRDITQCWRWSRETGHSSCSYSTACFADKDDDCGEGQTQRRRHKLAEERTHRFSFYGNACFFIRTPAVSGKGR